MSDADTATKGDRAWGWFPWAIAGAFVIVILVNGAMGYFAVHSFTGLVTEHPFELGNGYNAVLADGEAQDALGWHGSVRFIPNGTGKGIIEIAMNDAAGQPLTGLAMRAELVRPVEDLPAIPLTPAPGESGQYVAPVELSRLGQWEVRVRSERGKDSFVFAERIFVK